MAAFGSCRSAKGPRIGSRLGEVISGWRGTGEGGTRPVVLDQRSKATRSGPARWRGPGAALIRAALSP